MLLTEKKEKDGFLKPVTLSPHNSISSLDQPPPYSESQPPPASFQAPEDLSQRLGNLNISSLDEQSNQGALPPAELLVAHLKLLEAINILRLSVGATDGLFNIAGPSADLSEDREAQTQIREKRWAVYVARAVDRFKEWWSTAIPCSKGNEPYSPLTYSSLISNSKNIKIVEEGRPLADMTADRLPPLGKTAS